MRLLKLLLVLLVCATGPATAGPYEDATFAFQRRDYATELRLAEQGNVEAQYLLGYMHDFGYGVPQDYAKAVFWFQKAAEQGHALAQEYLGHLYRDGRGVAQDYLIAMFWYRKAAEQGEAGAQFNLGLLYSDGHGVPQDYVQAYMWYFLAAVNYDVSAASFRDSVAKAMTPAQIAEAQKLAYEWKPKPGRYGLWGSTPPSMLPPQ